MSTVLEGFKFKKPAFFEQIRTGIANRLEHISKRPNIGRSALRALELGALNVGFFGDIALTEKIPTIRTPWDVVILSTVVGLGAIGARAGIRYFKNENTRIAKKRDDRMMKKDSK